MLLKIYVSLFGRFEAVASSLRPFLIHGLKRDAGVTVGRLVRFRVTDGGTCFLGSKCAIERFSEITVQAGELRIGDHCFIGQGSIIVCRDKITIGRGCLIAESVTIRDQNHRFGNGVEVRNSGFETKPIEIGDNVWIGAKSCIISGVKIGSNSVIGAGSVVTKDCPSDAVMAGNPARVIGRTCGR